MKKKKALSSMGANYSSYLAKVSARTSGLRTRAEPSGGPS